MPRDPIGGAVRNLFDIQRLANGANAEVRSFIRALFDDIAAQLARIDPTGPDAERFRRARIKKLMGEVEGLAEEAFEEWRKTVRQSMAEIGKQQGAWAEGQLVRALGQVGIDVRIGRVGINLMKSIIDSNPFEGETLKGWAATQKAATIRRVRRQIQLGMTQNETLGDLVRRIRGRSDGRGGFTDGVLKTTTREAEAIVRTGVNFVANRGHLATYQQNADILKGVEYTAVLDSRTTFICMGLDGTVWALDDPNIQTPPLHFSCRSVLTPVADWEGLGLTAPPEGTRASADGQVPASTTYKDWLRTQPNAVQDEILGPSRAQLFRDGKVNLADLVKRDRSIVTVADLEKKAAKSSAQP